MNRSTALLGALAIAALVGPCTPLVHAAPPTAAVSTTRVAPAFVPSAGAAYSWFHGIARVTTCSTGGLWGTVQPCFFWSHTCTLGYRYNNRFVYVDFLDCAPDQGKGYSISKNQVIYNNGGRRGYGFLSAGDNFTVSAVMRGFPIQATYWQRVDVNCHGHWWTVQSTGSQREASDTASCA